MKGNVRKRRIYRLILCAVLVLALTAGTGLGVYGTSRRIPSTMYFLARQSQSMDLGVPATGEIRMVSAGRESNIPEGAVTIDLSKPVLMQTAGQEQYDMQVRLFGILPLKKVDIRVIEERELIPMGIPIGIYLKSRGVMVIGVGEFTASDGRIVSPAKNVLKSGDLILEMDKVPVSGKEDLMERLEGCKGRTVELKIERDGMTREVSLSPVLNQTGQYKAGIWIRDDAQGVGTLTYVDGSGAFGALGHGIADVDTGVIVNAKEGAIYQTEIVNLKRGEHGSPGEMTGRITYDEKYVLGDVRENSDRGVYGTCDQQMMQEISREAVPVGLKQEIELGPAQILCTIEDEVECFEVEITRVRAEGAYVNRGIELRVTDADLLRRTGGIVQGMSGSPILQNGKIIGAVTHVLVNTPERGYGIFIENMLEGVWN